MNKRISEYYSIEELAEKNLWFDNFVATIDIGCLKTDDITEILGVCFDLFYKDLFSENYDILDFVADFTENIVNKLIQMNSIEKIVSDHKMTNQLLSVVNLVYDASYKYTAKADILKSIIESERTTKEQKVCALENVLTGEPETMNCVGKDLERYKTMLEKLKA